VKGHVTVPRKKLIHVLACNYLVLLVDEYCTSKLCPYDFSELQDMGNRIRQCKTENHGATAEFTMDRDVIGSMNNLQKGVLGRNLQPLYQSVEAA
jgi:transposase